MGTKDKKRARKKIQLMLIIGFLIVLSLTLVNAQFDSSYSYTGGSFSPSSQYYGPSFQSYYSGDQIRTYWPVFGKEECEARQDFILTIRPGGCQPSVVRSDLLEEQNVPVFCKIDAIKVNPLIDIKAVSSMSFMGKYPDEVAGVGFHPARAAVRTYNTLLGSPLINNVGYVTIVLKRQENEEEMPDWVEGDLTARIRYDMEKAFGIGRAEFFLPVLTDLQWERNYAEYEFWRGRGFLRAHWVEPDRVSLSVYRDATHKDSTITLEKGRTSGEIYLGGFYCKAALQLRVQDITYPETRVKILVQGGGTEEVSWLYEKSRFLDNQCEVVKIDPLSLGGGSVTLRCGRENLILRLGMADSVNLTINDQKLTRKVWEPIFLEERIIYVAHVGQVPRQMVREEEERAFIVLIEAEDELPENITDGKLAGDIQNILETASRRNEKERFEESLSSIKRLGEIKDAEIVFYGESGAGNFSNIKFTKLAGSADKKYSGTNGEILERYFDLAIEEYEEVVQLYPGERNKQLENVETYGEKSLKAAVEVASKTGKQKTKKDLLNKIQVNYPNTASSKNAEQRLSETIKYDSGGAIRTIKLREEYYTIHVQDIKEPTKQEASATISLDDRGSATYAIRDYLFYPKESKETSQMEFIQLKSLDDEYVELSYAADYQTGNRWANTGTKTEKVKLREHTSLGRFDIFVSEINFQRVANVVVEPKIVRPYTEANLSFKIGIEKRAIKLSPEKTEEMIENINESIEKWEEISGKLRKVVKGWKGACYATSAVLLVKNLLDNFSGKSMARQRVMRGSGGWINRCKDIVDRGEEGYASLDDCLRGKNSEIEREVSAAHSVIKQINKEMKETESLTQETIFGERILDTEKSFKGFMEKFKDEEGGNEIVVIEDGKEKKFNMGELVGDYNEAYKEAFYTFSEAREWKYYNDMLEEEISPEMKEAYKKKLLEIYEGVEDRRAEYEFASSYNQELKATGLSLSVKGAYLERDARADIWDGSYLKRADLNNMDWDNVEEGKRLKIEEGEKVYAQMIPFAGSLYMFKLAESTDGKLVPTHQTYKVDVKDGELEVIKKIEESESKNMLSVRKGNLGISYFKKIEEGSCKNKYKDPQVRFYDVEPYKGLPGVVPFDSREGWYAGTKQIIKGFGLAPYTDAGLLKNFYLCNVGDNGREEFDSGIGDDICTFISFETGASPSHPCLTESEARRMADRARQAVMDASRQYARGVRKVRISGQEFDVGAPAGGAEGTQCQDFMSPEDCYWLFNTCDPVLCPSSRCNLGGNYYVKDVVQSGIIGSIALCLPNAREGIFVPVCLTGVQAGLDAYVSILKSHRDCLQESLETGRYVGFCDEMYSIFLCEFFWRQLSPLLDVAIPKIVELAYGKGTRGGGEYATITHAWDTLDNSVEYFTNHYAQSAYKAFTLRSTDEVGSEVCKSFISSRYPSSGEFFDALLEPESPVQYHAWFDEIPFSEATLPSTSHYKVFYHIWAGHDEGAYYSVYLKNPPESSFYATTPRIVVDTGYVQTGGYASETRDFTAPAGYKTLCVRVNLQEECGFGQVSTSYAVNYLREGYIKDQTTQQITKEEDCMSGTPSLYSLARPNIQEGVADVVRPAEAGTLYKSGIIRICSTENPGKQVDPERWKDVGFCDNSKVRCWLDLQSVEANIRSDATLTEIEKGVGDIDRKRINELVEKGEILSEMQSNNDLENAKTKIEQVRVKHKAKITDAKTFLDAVLAELGDTLKALEKVEMEGYWNSQRAEAIFLRAQIYDFIAGKVYEGFFEKGVEIPPVGKPEDSGEGAGGEEEAGEEESGIDLSEINVGDRLIDVNGDIFLVQVSQADNGEWKILLQNIADNNDKRVIDDSKSTRISEYGYSVHTRAPLII